MPNLITERVVYDALVALNFSGAKELLKSPAHYQSYLARNREETKALRVGSYVHALVLEPAKAVTKFAVAPECDKRTKEGKAIFADWEATKPEGATVMTAEEAVMCEAVANAMSNARNALGITFTETELMFLSDDNGVPVKTAIDAIGSDGYLYDLKTTEDASPQGFLKAVRAYRYNLQAYVYRTAFERAFKQRPLGFRFIVCEKEPPYATAVYEIGPELMSYAVADWERARKLWADCTESNVWPGYPSEVQVVDLKATTASTPINFA